MPKRRNPDGTYLVTVDSRGRVTLPGRPNERFLMSVHSDGSILLQPAVVVPVTPKES